MNSAFDFNQAAELYPGRGSQAARHERYMRFPSAAEAIRYAVEDMNRDRLKHTSMEVEDERIEGEAILRLYKSSHYPLSRARL